MPTDTSGRWLPDLPDHDVVREVGRGGMGMVYEAVERRSGARVALKTLQAFDAAALYRFKQEFRGFADVLHPNLVALHELRSDGSVWFFTMELVEGRHFLTYLREHPERLRDAFAQLADGLCALHAAGKVHRDVKPGNVLVTGEGRVVLLDFGLAADLAADGLHRSTKSHVLGTVPYMSPEQANARPVSSASDVYSTGVMLFEALTGRLPFDGDAFQVLIDKRSRAAPRASSVATGVPADLDALCDEMLARDVLARPAAGTVRQRLTEAAGALGSAGLPLQAAPARHLVGRDGHLAALTRALDALQRRKPVLALVHGASGMGKSVLVQSFVDEVVVSRHAVVLSGRCYERESVPYKALDSAMDALARHLARLPAHDAAALLPRDVGALTRVFPVLRRAEAVAAAPFATTDPLDPAELRRRAFAALRELLARIADRAPLVLWADDLQWGDADSAELLTAVLRPPDPPAMLVIGSYRREDAASSAFLSAALPATEGLAERVEIAVDPLDERDATELAARLTGGDAERTAAVARESRGNPFFLHELAEFGAGAAAGDLTLDAVVADRVSRLVPDARSLLESVAVSGGPLALQSALQAAGVDASARAAVSALRSGRLVRLVGAAPSELIDTYHDRIRETVAGGLAAAALRECHRRLGLALEMSRDSDPEKLAVHFQGGGELDRAGTHYERAAEKAAAALAFDHAARLYRLSIELKSPGDEQRRRLLRCVADCLASARRGPDAAATYLEASRGAPEVEARELSRLAGEQYLTVGRLDEAIRVLEPIVPSIRAIVEASTARNVVRLALNRLRLRLRGFEFRERPVRDVDAGALARCDILSTFAMCYSQVDVLAGIVFHSEAMRASLEIGEPSRVARQIPLEVAIRTGINLQAEGPMAKLLEDARKMGERVGDRATIAILALFRGTTPWFGGRWREAVANLDEAQERLRNLGIGATWARNMACLYGLMALDFSGEIAELRRRLGPALDDAQQRGDLYLRTDLVTRIVPVERLAADAPQEAEAAVRGATASWSQRRFQMQHYRAAEWVTNIALYGGDAEAARREAGAMRKGARGTGLLRAPMLAWVLTALGARADLLEAVGGERARSTRLKSAARAGRLLCRGRFDFVRQWGEVVLAGVDSVRGETAACLARLESAERGFAAADMKLYAATCRRRRGQLVGGTAGAALVAEADAVFTGEGIVRPDRWADMYAPGRWE